MVNVADVVAVLDDLYDPAWAEPWDAVGTVLGDPDAPVRKILFAVDPVQAVADEAVDWDADLVVVHHPLYLSGVTSVAATTPKGRIVHTLVSHGIALHTCHTNADTPPGGVSAAMAEVFGLLDVRPLQPDTDDGLDKWIVFVPRDDTDAVAAALGSAGGGAIGDYDRCTFRLDGTGTFRPLQGANPTVGRVGDLERIAETRLEMIAPRAARASMLAALRSAHPYEEPAFDVFEVAAVPVDRGSGRIGRLETPVTLEDFSLLVAERLPGHHGATRVAGDPGRMIETVGLCGGSGDFLLPVADGAGADVYVTSDLKHHPVSEHLERPRACAVIDVPHWAAEWTWLPVAERELTARLGDVETRVSRIVTDPWARTLARDEWVR